MGCCSSKTTGGLETADQKKRGESKLMTHGPGDHPTPITNPVVDKEPWKRLTIPDRVKIPEHEHALDKMEDYELNSWVCDAEHIFHRCYGGITNIKETIGVRGWTCREVETCNFDICKQCV